jgi:DNA-directed RNA polymerase specialized sigma24 family protein
VLGSQNHLFYLGPGFRFRIYIDTTWHFIWGWGGKASKHQWAILPLTAVKDPNASISWGSKTIRGSRNLQRPDLRRGTGFGKGDLVREAICRALEGDRNCPRDVPFMAFLVMTMKSMASHAREKHHRTFSQADPPERSPSDAPDLPTAPSPEDAMIAASVLREIHAHFENADEATLVLMGWAEGLRGKALREATGLDQGGLDYAIKRIRVGARKLYPEGWTT